MSAQEVTDSVSTLQQTEEPEKVWVIVDKQPEFPGGMGELINFLSREVKYPKTAMENNVQGTVRVSFVVNKDGSLSDVRVTQSVDEELDQEALRVVNAMPAWQPAMAKNEPVRCRFTLPISFKAIGFSSSTTEPQKQEVQPEERKKKKRKK